MRSAKEGARDPLFPCCGARVTLIQAMISLPHAPVGRSVVHRLQKQEVVSRRPWGGRQPPHPHARTGGRGGEESGGFVPGGWVRGSGGSRSSITGQLEQLGSNRQATTKNSSPPCGAGGPIKRYGGSRAVARAEKVTNHRAPLLLANPAQPIGEK